MLLLLLLLLLLLPPLAVNAAEAAEGPLHDARRPEPDTRQVPLPQAEDAEAQGPLVGAPARSAPAGHPGGSKPARARRGAPARTPDAAPAAADSCEWVELPSVVELAKGLRAGPTRRWALTFKTPPLGPPSRAGQRLAQRPFSSKLCELHR
eukprot:12977361-Heterocapsa_arctica.AAC.1